VGIEDGDAAAFDRIREFASNEKARLDFEPAFGAGERSHQNSTG
jgi:hypothetical protein